MQVIKHTFTILKMNMELICDLNVSYFPQALVACTLEFQIEGGGRGGGGRGAGGAEKTGTLADFSQNNKRGGCKKWGG